MGIRSFLKGQRVMDEAREKYGARETRDTLANPSDDLLETLGGSPTPSGKRVTPAKALGLSPVWAAVNIIAEQVGQLPFKVYRKVDGNRIEADSHPAWEMLHDKPNLYTPADRFWAAVTTQLLLYGNAFIEKERGPDAGGRVDALWLLDPECVTVEWTPSTKTKRFLYDPSEIGLERRIYTNREVLHIFGLSVDGIVGLSVVHACRNALGTALAREEFEGGFYGRGATLRGVIEHPGKLSEDAAKSLKSSFSAIYGGSERAHQTAVLEEGATLNTVSSPMTDLEFVASQQLTRTDIATMFKLPPNYLGGTSGDSLTYSTVEANQIQFAQHAIAPWTNVIAKAVSNDPSFMPQSVHYAEFTLDAMMRSDAVTRATFYKALHDMGALTPNEIRERENMPKIAGGDKPMPQTPAQPSPSPSVALNGNGNGAAPGVSILGGSNAGRPRLQP